MATDRERTYRFSYEDERKMMKAQSAAEERDYLVHVYKSLGDIQLQVKGENPEELDEVMATLGGVTHGA